jgi:16S rRNA (cytosine1402-N4)-methyltransferase
MSIHTPQQLQPDADEVNSSPVHQPVLLDQVVELLAPQLGQTYLDVTAGYGGHARVLAKHVGGYDHVTLVDRDSNAVAALKDVEQQGATLIHDDFAHAAELFVEEGRTVDMVLVDLGVSSPQLDVATRGFSFTRPGPLDMRMDDRQATTAANLANRLKERDLAQLIADFGQEPRGKAARIARAIVRARPLRTTDDLARAVLTAHHGPHQRIHPATRTFQALRIALNDELGQIRRMLDCLPKLLNSGGRVAIISFHSLEDHLVKHWLKEHSYGLLAEFEPLPPPVFGRDSDVSNPRARSAILRAAVKK